MDSTKRVFIRLWALCLCAALLFAACSAPASSQSGAGAGSGSSSNSSSRATDGYIPPKGLTVWALSSLFSGNYDVYIKKLAELGILGDHYRVSMTYGIELPPGVFEVSGAKAEEDAIDGLITEILAGTGPDIIIMDGLNARDFAAQGVLMDLSAAAAGAGLYENLADSLRVNGELPYIPYNVRAPLLVGDPAHVNAVQSFPDLVGLMAQAGPPRWPGPERMGNLAYVHIDAPEDDPLMIKPPEALPGEACEPISFIPRAAGGAGVLSYPSGVVYAPFFISGNQVDTALLTEYYTETKQLDAIANQTPELTAYHTLILSLHGVFTGGLGAGWVDVDRPLAGWYLGESHMAYVSGGMFTYALPSFLASARGLPVTARPVPGHGAVWQPDFLMAVSKNTQNPEAAMQFIKDMLSDGMQVKNERVPSVINPFTQATLPVTQSAVEIVTQEQFPRLLRQNYAFEQEWYDENYVAEGYDMGWLAEHEFMYDLDALMRSFDTAYIPDLVVEAAVEENLAAVLSGALTPAEAAARCEEDLQVYLNERQR